MIFRKIWNEHNVDPCTVCQGYDEKPEANKTDPRCWYCASLVEVVNKKSPSKRKPKKALVKD